MAGRAAGARRRTLAGIHAMSSPPCAAIASGRSVPRDRPGGVARITRTATSPWVPAKAAASSTIAAVAGQAGSTMTVSEGLAGAEPVVAGSTAAGRFAGVLVVGGVVDGEDDGGDVQRSAEAGAASPSATI